MNVVAGEKCNFAFWYILTEFQETICKINIHDTGASYT